jgi:hypothetical protein
MITSIPYALPPSATAIRTPTMFVSTDIGATSVSMRRFE